MKTHPKPSFILIERGEGGDPCVIRAFDTEAERDDATINAIYGPACREECPPDMREAYLSEARRDGCITFEGDPGLEWTTGWLYNKDTERIKKLDDVLCHDPFMVRLKWDNHNDSGIYIKDGLGKRIGHSEQLGDEGDSEGLTLRAAIDSIPVMSLPSSDRDP